MAQNFTDDCFAGSHVGQTDLQNMENNFACLKSSFSGSSAPSNPVAGMFWYDTSAHILKLRNEANNAWLSIWDLANNKPVASNLTIDDFAASLKGPAAGTFGFRKLGTGATDACAGNDSRLSDARSPTDNSVTGAKFANITASATVQISANTARTFNNTSYQKYKEIEIKRNGTVRLHWEAYRNGANTIYTKAYKNGSPIGSEHLENTDGVKTYDENYSCSVGDKFQVYCRINHTSGTIQNCQLRFTDPSEKGIVNTD